MRTFGEAFMRSHALPYSTVGEFGENSSDVRAYINIAENPAPSNITVKFVDRAAALVTTRGSSQRGKRRENEVDNTFPTSAQLRPLFNLLSMPNRRLHA